MEPSFAGVAFLLACIGAHAVLLSAFKTPTARRGSASAPHTLEVDITGRGNWVVQMRGDLPELKHEASRIRKREGMQTRIN